MALPLEHKEIRLSASKEIFISTGLPDLKPSNVRTCIAVGKKAIAFFLCPVHGTVSMFQEGLRIMSVIGIGACPDAGRHKIDLSALDDIWLGQTFQNPGSHLIKI
jgi:hypothetical protein